MTNKRKEKQFIFVDKEDGSYLNDIQLKENSVAFDIMNADSIMDAKKAYAYNDIEEFEKAIELMREHGLKDLGKIADLLGYEPVVANITIEFTDLDGNPMDVAEPETEHEHLCEEVDFLQKLDELMREMGN
ncbi:hypothetical protein QP168_09415 [Aerococcus urinae]|uniref:Uncharacterized protein n=1 Tax=Aerococcus mictus TaxID=2976810 RepID=A0A1E9PGU8_9LACT|nr:MULTISPECIES: hypothetical protein [Aerococcus]KAA9291231.1 hypothetical protein F6I06_06175 [Aerococcus mictus]MBU5611152.1 hypothetical protein [Aerococcus urinae]MCY3064940.1 hypothetical protein [Aerococcus mictus]MCY3077337.1 hypothetical protein [Aerococcus mictus]MCY3081436.1 hypothetical protein [Aerococcus mictus]